MKKLLFIIALLLARGSTLAQTDTMYVVLGSTVKAYAVQNIAQIQFLTSITGVNAEDLNKMNEILNSFTLHQNYPNPFNPSTTITYHLPASGNAKVSIFDIAGRLIQELLNSPQEAGDHTVVWNSQASGASSGVYFLQVQFNSSLLTKKMILIK